MPVNLLRRRLNNDCIKLIFLFSLLMQVCSRIEIITKKQFDNYVLAVQSTADKNYREMGKRISYLPKLSSTFFNANKAISFGILIPSI